MTQLTQAAAGVWSRDLTVGILTLALALLAASIFIVIRLFWRASRQKSRLRNERTFCAALSDLDRECHLLLRREDLFALYAAGDLTGLTGLTLEDVQRDAERLFSIMDDAPARTARRAFHNWDGTSPLAFSFYCAATGRWLNIALSSPGPEQDLLVTLRDVTQAHAEQEALSLRLEKAENLSQSKSSLLSNMSHEIRTPINGILGLLSLSRSHLGADDAAVESYLSKADDLSQHLLSIVNDILDISRIEAGKIELEQKPMDLYALGDQLRSMFQSSIEAKGLSFDLHFDGFSARYVVGDRLRLTQVLVNLLSNAQKFTSEGGVSVLFRQMMHQDDHIDFLIQVRDTGIGMDPAFISRIFRPFEQESMETAHKYGGSGLGMAITDQLVRLMGGKIMVESMPGSGSCFTVFLNLPIADAPAEPAPAAVAPAAPARPFQGRRILLAEDNELNAEIAVSILQEQDGAAVEVARDGQEAVDRFCAPDAGYYDFILMDVQMPVLDGRAATRKLRALSRPDAQEIPIFALSADAFVEDIRASQRAGMNGHFPKPIDFDLLRREIGGYLHQKEAQG